MKYNNSEKYGFLKIDYKRRKKLLDNPHLRLPDAQNAVLDDRKFTNYLFGGNNTDGLAKGKAFNSRLGYNDKNWKDLKDEIVQKAQSNIAVPSGNTPQGNIKYVQKMVIYGIKNTPANVKVVWVYEDKTVRMVTAFIEEV